jgi:hypothetical protein
MIGQPNALATLRPGKGFPVSILWEAGWAPETLRVQNTKVYRKVSGQSQ